MLPELLNIYLVLIVVINIFLSYGIFRWIHITGIKFTSKINYLKLQIFERSQTSLSSNFASSVLMVRDYF